MLRVFFCVCEQNSAGIAQRLALHWNQQLLGNAASELELQLNTFMFL